VLPIILGVQFFAQLPSPAVIALSPQCRRLSRRASSARALESGSSTGPSADSPRPSWDFSKFAAPYRLRPSASSIPTRPSGHWKRADWVISRTSSLLTIIAVPEMTYQIQTDVRSHTSDRFEHLYSLGPSCNFLVHLSVAPSPLSGARTSLTAWFEGDEMT
jgi:hypothetical protein